MKRTASSFDDAYRLLFTEPASSEAFCRSVLEQRDDPSARLMLAGALRLQGDFAGALAEASVVASAHPAWGGALFEQGMALAGLKRHAEALQLLRQVAQRGALPGLWREIGDQHWALNDRPSAEHAYLRHLGSEDPEPLVYEAVTALRTNDSAAGERSLLLQLKIYPGDVLALRMLAELMSSLARYDESESLLHLCLERAPSFALVRFGLATVLFHNHKLPQAVEQADILLAAEPDRLEYLNLKADALGRLGEFEAAADCLKRVIALYPKAAGAAWSNYGHFLRALGKRAECEAAYRSAIAIGDSVGEAYWGLANLKTFEFEAHDIDQMRTALARSDITREGRVSLLFALGAALEGRKSYEEAFAAYRDANALHREALQHNRSERVEAVQRARAFFTASFFAEREGAGRQDDDPIFIVGMPRSGSTLVEQIVASHSSVEGTMELVEMLAIAKRLESGGAYPELLRDIPARELREIGSEYLDRSRVFRKTNAPQFIDKMPNNFTQIGLIHLILPNARIVDVRRHPLACCFSIFKQHWATGQSFAYDLADIGSFYREYVALMAHFDAVLPGRVHRVIYENLVAEPERETRRLLEACALPFEEQCLRFYENTRAVRTPSSEQVRRPINQAGLDAWRSFEPWLGPLKAELGPVLDSYPAPPAI